MLVVLGEEMKAYLVFTRHGWIDVSDFLVRFLKGRGYPSGWLQGIDADEL